MNVVIMRGIPGSGKSTWVKQNYPSALVVSADQYFMVGNNYVFRKELLPKVHDECLKNYLKALKNRTELIVVDNTNLKVFEIAPYYRLAEVFNYKVKIIYLAVDPDNGENVHGVPKEIVQQMAKGIEPVPYWWNHQFIMRTNNERIIPAPKTS